MEAECLMKKLNLNISRTKMVETSCKKTRIKKSYRTYSTANKGHSMVNYCQSFVFDCPYLLCNDHCDQYLFHKIFFLLILFLFLQILWTILNLFSWNLNTFPKNKKQVCFLFICSFFTCCFLIILWINPLQLSILFCCM